MKPKEMAVDCHFPLEKRLKSKLFGKRFNVPASVSSK